MEIMRKYIDMDLIVQTDEIAIVNVGSSSTENKVIESKKKKSGKKLDIFEVLENDILNQSLVNAENLKENPFNDRLEDMLLKIIERGFPEKEDSKKSIADDKEESKPIKNT